MPEKTDKEHLEAMIDKEGLHAVLFDLAAVCREKADHIRENWQDKTTAKAWDKRAKAIDAAWTKVSAI